MGIIGTFTLDVDQSLGVWRDFGLKAWCSTAAPICPAAATRQVACGFGAEARAGGKNGSSWRLAIFWGASRWRPRAF